MVSQYSIYAINESQPPQWRPQEDKAAAGFIAVALWLVVDTNFCILRTFKKRTGLYYWTLQIGILGVGLDSIGVILKYLTPSSVRYWEFPTICLLLGWTCYAPTQLLVLYSRLHLINDVVWIRRSILYMIIATYFCFVLPTWVLNWASYDPSGDISQIWSPRTAILERITQIGFTLVELFISVVYIQSLLRIMKGRVTVRQRRIMNDLIYVVAMGVAFDLLCVVFIYLNELGISHPIQTFSYGLKLKLEFLVLNQLMSVAARGLNKRTWEDRRYHHGGIEDDFSAQARKWGLRGDEEAISPPQLFPENTESTERLSGFPIHKSGHENTNMSSGAISPTDSDAKGNNTSFPFPAPHLDSSDADLGTAIRRSVFGRRSSSAKSSPAQPPHAVTGQSETPLNGSSHPQPSSHPPAGPQSEKGSSQHIARPPFAYTVSGITKQRSPSSTSKPSQTRPPLTSQRSHLDFNPNKPFNATLRLPKRKNRHPDDEDDEAEEIGVHMWEYREHPRAGSMMLVAPWMSKADQIPMGKPADADTAEKGIAL